jgi:hypothetical protein
MQITESSISLDRRKTIISIVFIAWLISLPLGAKFLTLDVGPTTFYPNLVFSLVLSAVSILYIKNWTKLVWLLIIFLVLWCVQGTIQFQSGPKNYTALFDVRSLFMQLIFALCIITPFYALGYERFKRNLVLGLKFFLVILLIFGFFEVITGIHLKGATTAQYEHLTASKILYAPMFIFDNVNDYLAYAISISFFLMVFDPGFRKEWMLPLGIFAVLFYFSDIAESRFAKCISFNLMIFCVLAQVRKNWKERNRQTAWIVFGSVIAACIILVSNSLFLGPKYGESKKYRLNELRSFEKEKNAWKVKYLDKELSAADKLELIDFLDSLEVNNPHNSGNLRANLILNGIDFMKEAPVLGIGPGQYIQRHVDGKAARKVGTLTSAHCFPIEIISQFGITAWVYFLLLGGLVIGIVREFIRNKSWNIWFLLMMICLPLIWCMPSAFLYFDIHRLLAPILLVYLLSLREKPYDPA